MWSSGKDRFSPWVATALSGVLLILGASGTLFWNDAGELSTAAVSMGVPHPTGFSLWTAWARLFTWLPIGSLDLRLSLASVVPMAMTIGLLSSLLGLASRRAGWKLSPKLDLLILGLLFPILALRSSTVWYLACTPEVYSLTALISFTVLWLLVQDESRVSNEQKVRVLIIFTGLVPSIHVSASAVYLPAALLMLPSSVMGRIDLKQGLRSHRWWEIVALFLLSALSVFALVSAASREPVLNFGDPSDLKALWDHLSAKSIRSAFSSEGAKGLWAENWVAHRELLLTELGTAVLLLAASSLFWVRRVGLIRMLWSVALFDFAYSLWVNPMGRRDLQTGSLTLLALTSLAIITVLGVVHLCQSGLRRRAPNQKLIWGAQILLTIVVLAWASWETRALAGDDERWTIRHDPTATQWFRISSAQMPPSSTVFIGGSDNLTSTSLSMRYLDGRRPDLVQIITPYAWWPSWIGSCEHCEQHGPQEWRALSEAVVALEASGGLLSLSPQEQLDVQHAILKLWMNWAQHTPAVFWELGSGMDAAAGRVTPKFLFARVGASSERMSPVASARTALETPKVPRHPWSRRATSDSLRVTANFAPSLQERVDWTAAATILDPQNGRAWRNLGSLFLRQGKVPQSEAALEKAAKERPYDSGVWRNLALARWELRKVEQARAALDRAERFARSPGDRAKISRIRAELIRD